MNNIVPMQKPLAALAEELRSAIVRCDEVHTLWIESTVDLAFKFQEARERFPSNQEFGQWLFENGLDDYSADNRAALLNMIEQPDTLRYVMIEHVVQVEPVTIWRKYQDRFRQESKTTDNAELNPESPMPTDTSPDPHESGIEPPQKFTRDDSTPGRRPALLRLPFEKTELVAAHYHNKRMISWLGSMFPKRKSQRYVVLWMLLLDSIESGVFGEPSDTIISEPNARLLFPWITAHEAKKLRFDLTALHDLEIVRDDLMPWVKENIATLRERPDQFAALYSRHRFLVETRLREQMREQTREQVVAKLPVNEQPIIVFGRHLWPVTEGLVEYSYDELCLACWFCQLLYPSLRQTDPQSRQMNVSAAMKFTPESAQGWVAAVRAYGAAFHADPAGECVIPPPPPNFRIK